MSAPDPLAPRMRWWGWGEDGASSGLSDGAREMVQQAFQPAENPPPRVELDDVRLPEVTLSESVRTRLADIVGGANLRDDRLARVSHAAGRSYPDLVRLRAGDLPDAPDAIAYPADAEQIAGLLRACAEDHVAVVPFGGGTSVVGGVTPVRDGFAGVVSLDLARLDGLVGVDDRSLTAALEPGVTGPRSEALLGRHGLTLGHFPQSFEFATIGGFVATRSAGQASTGYGRIDELVLGLRLESPAGTIEGRTVPATAAGPDLRELLVGSEGVLGTIVETTFRVRRLPERRLYEGFGFEAFEQGVEAFREMEQAEASPDVARLSDEAETALSRATAGGSGATDAPPCLVILGFEGRADEVEERRRRTTGLLESAGGKPLGEAPGESWNHGRYAGPYLRDDLLDLGVMVETLETATTWSGLERLYRAVGNALRDALSARGTPPVVLCHVSHLYPAGASLYFTFIARQEPGAEMEQWQAAKVAACDAIVGNGGTITHHHAVGRDHAPWMPAEVGELGVELLRAAKERLDPAGIMNPGKLLPDESR